MRWPVASCSARSVSLPIVSAFPVSWKSGVSGNGKSPIGPPLTKGQICQSRRSSPSISTSATSTGSWSIVSPSSFRPSIFAPCCALRHTQRGRPLSRFRRLRVWRRCLADPAGMSPAPFRIRPLRPVRVNVGAGSTRCGIAAASKGWDRARFLWAAWRTPATPRAGREDRRESGIWVKPANSKDRVDDPKAIEDLEGAGLDAFSTGALEGSSAASMRRQEIPRRRRSRARVKPVGPAPIIKTVSSYMVRKI